MREGRTGSRETAQAAKQAASTTRDLFVVAPKEAAAASAEQLLERRFLLWLRSRCRFLLLGLGCGSGLGLLLGSLDAGTTEQGVSVIAIGQTFVLTAKQAATAALLGRRRGRSLLGRSGRGQHRYSAKEPAGSGLLVI